MNNILEVIREYADGGSVFFIWLRDNLSRVIFTAIALVVAWIVFGVLKRAVKKASAEKMSAQRSLIVKKILNYLYYIILLMIILNLFGVKLSAIWGAAGVAGVAIAFAAQTSVSNVISGLFVLAEKVFKVGDLITAGGETGIVDNIGLLSTTIHTPDNQLIRIPNSTIIGSTMRNTSYYNKRRMSIECSVSYDTDLQKALDTLAKAPDYCPNALKDPAPAVWIDKFGDSGINMTLVLWFNPSELLLVKNQAFVAVKRVFDEAKIEIPYNKVDVLLYDQKV